jgi:hypothetical protein
MTENFITPRTWIARERAVRHIWSLTRKLGVEVELATEAQRAADEDDDGAFVAAVAAFLEAMHEAKERD